MKKALIVLLCLSMAAGFVFAEGQAQTGAPAAAKEAEIVNGRFTTTRNITVEIFDRSNAGGSKPEDNVWTEFIKAGMLRDHNVAVTFRPVPRWTEVDVMNNLLAASDAPDICVTYSYPTIQIYANMGGVVDLAPYLSQYKADLTNLWSLLGDRNIYYDQDPNTGKLWAIEALLFQNNRVSTFVREDWLKKLNMPLPTNIAEFEKTLRAFKDNAKLLLGDNADKMVPFTISTDVGWRADLLTMAFVPDSLTDEQAYIYGFDDRHLQYPGVKEGIRQLNKWYADGLIWKDFAVYPSGDKTEDNNMKAGYVGAMIHNWDYPYRDGENGVHGQMKKIVGADAAFIAVDTFKNDAGKYRKFLSNPVDRKVFFPATNDEPVASLFYLDWISKLDNRRFLQIGEPGVNHIVLDDGAIKATPVSGPKIMNSGNNIDYTITINGLDTGDTAKNLKSLALAYAGVDARFLEASYAVQRRDSRIIKPYKLGEIKSEEGMSTVNQTKRDNLLVQAIVAKPADFDAVWDKNWKDYLGSFAQAIIDERTAKLKAATKK